MIETPTVLILGAGASNHLGYPVGRGLKNEICRAAAEGQCHSHIKDHYGPNALREFYLTFSRSAHSSIDAFLEANATWSELGRLLIADCLKRHEIEERLFPPHDPGWYSYLFGRMVTNSLEEFQRNRVAIVTFNYDRSLEVFLTQAVQHHYRVSQYEAVATVRELSIIHPYGTLGLYPEIDYGTEADDEILTAASTSIKIVSDLEDERESFCSPEFETAKALLQEAGRICFLGFGFHDENVRRFDFFKPGAVAGKEVASTADHYEAEMTELLMKLEPYGLDRGMFKGFSHINCDRFFRQRATLT